MSVAERCHDELSDEQLVLRYRKANDQAAFAILLRRHHQLVLGVCQQALGHRQDAEDAFQATFIVFARDARRIRKPNALANWLYGVAYRISMRVRRQRARNRTVEIQEQTVDSTALHPLDHLTRRYQQGVAYDELSRLPDRLRTPMILRYLSGKSNQEIAAQLKLTEAAVEGRLKRAKAKLRVRLTGHGVTLAIALSMLRVETVSADSDLLLESTIDRCLTHSTTEPASAEAGEIVQLANQEMFVMTTTHAVKCGIYGAVALCATALTLTFNPLTESSWASDPSDTQTVQVESPLGDVDSAGDTAKVVELAAAEADPFAGRKSGTTGPSADPFEAPGQDAPAASTDPFAGPAATGAGSDPFDAGLTTARPANQPPEAVDLKQRSKMEIRIGTALRTETKLAFSDTPLIAAIHYISQLHGIQIVIDELALENEGISTDTSLDMEISGIPLRNALNLALRPRHLDYVIHDEVLLITTKAAAESMLETRVYPFRSGVIQQTQMVEFITSSIAPHSWAEVGGEGVIAAFARGLIIRQTAKVHDEIAELLRQVSQTERATN